MASQIPKPIVPRPPIAHSTLASVSTRRSPVQPKAKALKMTTVATAAKAARRWRKRSQSYSDTAARTLSGDSDEELRQPPAHRLGDGADVGLQAVVARDLGDGPPRALGRHPELITLALDDEGGGAHSIELVEAARRIRLVAAGARLERKREA